MTDDVIENFDTQPARLAYIRSVAKIDVADAPDDAPETLYALHDEQGRPLAVFSSRDTALIAARSHNFEAHTVH